MSGGETFLSRSGTRGARPPEAAPVAARERIALVDILRGFALLGVLLFNIIAFAAEQQDMAMWTGPVDRLILPLRDFLVQAKFYSLFSFLFGWGMAIQMARAEERGGRFWPLYLRRLFFLLLIGLAHRIFLWDGDILTIYALMGLALLLVRRWRPRTLLWAAGLLLLGTILLQTPPLQPVQAAVTRLTGSLQQLGAVAGSGPLSGWLRAQWRDLAHLPSSLLFNFGNIFSMFLLGLYAGKRHLFRDLQEHLPFWRRLLLPALVVGLLGNALFVMLRHWPELAWVAWIPPERRALLATGARTFGAPALMLFYVSALTLLLQREAWRQRLAPLGPVGRMALSNYLLQTVIASLIYNENGLGFRGRTGPTFNLLLALLIFAAQIYFSRWWLARYRFGPMEWVWRSLTYGHRQSLRRQERLSARWSLSRQQTILVLAALLVLGSLFGWRRWRADSSERDESALVQESHIVMVTPTPIVPVVTPAAAGTVSTAEAAAGSSVLAQVEPVAYEPQAQLAAGDWAALVESFDTAAVLDTVAALAGPDYAGRAAGTPGGHAAGEAIAERFRQAGLQPAVSGDFFQPFPIQQTVLASAPHFSVETAAGVVDDYQPYRDFAPAVQGYMGAGAAAGPVVWVNNCAVEDFRQVEVVDKIVLCRADWPRVEMARQAIEHGAAGLLLLASPEAYPLDFTPIYHERWIPEALALPAMRISQAVAADLLAGSGKTVADLSLSFDSFPLQTEARLEVATAQPAGCAAGECQARNVLGLLPGRDPAHAGELLILSAHYDHLGQSPDGITWGGANDNASGVAAMLEIARSWREAGYVPRRSVLFAAWDAEELGLLGSRYYLHQPLHPLTQTVGLINLDMVGAGEETLYIDGQGLDDQLLGIAASMGITGTISHVGRSDHAPFLEAGVPAAMLAWSAGGGNVPDYHGPSDTIETIEPQQLERAGRLAALMALSLAEVEPQLDTLLARRAQALLSGDGQSFLATSLPARRAADQNWFADLQSLSPFTATLRAEEVQLLGNTAVAAVTLDVGYTDLTEGGDVLTRTLSVPMRARFAAGPDGWQWAGPDLLTANPTAGDAFAIAIPPGAPWEETEGLARALGEQYAALASRLGLPPAGVATFFLYEDAQALRADTSLTLPAGASLRVEPDAVRMVYTEAMTRSQLLPTALAQLALAQAGLSEAEIPWLWQGLAPVLDAAADPAAAQRRYLPRLQAALEAEVGAEAAEEEAALAQEATSWAAVDYLQQQVGWEGLGRFILTAGAQGEEAALQEALGLSPVAFAGAWQGNWLARLQQARAAVNRVLLARMNAVANGDPSAFLATVDETVPMLQSEARRQFAAFGDYPASVYDLTARPLLLYEDGRVLAQVTLVYELDNLPAARRGGSLQQEILFTPGPDGLRWAGPPFERLAEGAVTVLYPPGQVDLAAALLDIARRDLPELQRFFEGSAAAEGPWLVKLYGEDNSFRASLPLSTAVTEEMVGHAAAGEAIKLRGPSLTRLEDYHAALLELAVRRQLAQLGVGDPWLLQGSASYLAARLGAAPLQRQLSGNLRNMWLALSNKRLDGLDEMEALLSVADGHQQTLAAVEAWDAIRFLVDAHGEEALLALLRAQAGGASLDEALRASTGQSLAEFEQTWRDSLSRAHAEPAWIELADAFDVAQAEAHVAALTAPALQGRRAGSPGERQAARYIAQQFAAYGLQPVVPPPDYEAGITQPAPVPTPVLSATTSLTTTTVLTGSEGVTSTTATLTPVAFPLTATVPLTYFQPFTLESASLATAPRLLIADEQGQPAGAFRYRQDFLTALDALPAGGSASGQLVIVNRADYFGMDLSGKIALRLKPQSPSAEMELALAHGAAGLLLVGDTSYEKDLLAKEPLPPWLLHEDSLPVLSLTGPGMEQLQEVTGLTPADLNNLPPALPLDLWVQMDIPLSPGEVVTSSNVLGLLPGSDPRLRQELLVVGAHYDHVGDDPETLLCDGRQIVDPLAFSEASCERLPGLTYSGANDNASGVALLLETARLWHESGYRPARSVLFVAWGAQEVGELGARAQLQAPLLPPAVASDQPPLTANTVGVVVLDGVGGGAGYRLLAQGSWEQEGEMLFALEMADEALEGHATISPAETAWSDEAVFRAAGLPTVLLTWTDASEANWPDSIADPVQSERLGISGRMLSLALMSLAR